MDAKTRRAWVVHHADKLRQVANPLENSVTNGMAMCPTHHRAFDRDVPLVTADHKIRIQHALGGSVC
jgi:predicted restriction endonuclease